MVQGHSKSHCQSLIEKFSEPEPNTGCWIWISFLDKNGYPLINLDKLRKAHRVSFWAFKGDLNNLWCLHKCDTPSCVNPAHLFAGTAKDNAVDMHKKGRSAIARYPYKYAKKGTFHKDAKLNEEKVKNIRNEYVPFSRIKGGSALGRKYGVSSKTIEAVVNRRVWKHVD